MGVLAGLLRLALRYRSVVLVLTALLVAVGIRSAVNLPIDAVPDITNVQVQINTQAPGYSPLETEQRVTYPIETVMAGLPNLEQTRSLSRYGLSQVTVIFKDGTDIYFARQLVNERIQEARDKLPVGITPALGPISTGLGEIYLWTVEAKDGAKKPDGMPYTATDLREIQDWIIKPQLRNVPGVTEINSIGGYAKEYQIAPIPARLASLGVTLQDIVTALDRNNGNVGAGYIEKRGEQYLIRAPGQVKTLEDIGNVILSSAGGVPIRVRDVADVGLGRELRTGAATDNGREVVLGTVFMLIGENSRDVSKAVDARLQAINKTLPEGIVAKTVYDRTILVEKAIDTVKKNLTEGALLVIAILFLFLGNIRAALITAMDVPLAPLLVDWFKELRTYVSRSDFVLPARARSRAERNGGDTHLSKDTVRESIDYWIKQYRPSVRRFTPHDLRSTMKSHMRALGVPRDISEMCLNHKLTGVEGIYDQHTYYSERRQALLEVVVRPS